MLGTRALVDRPEEVGADRLVNTVAAHDRYRGPLIVVDFGTATTLDVVDGDGNYRGGVIAPGINLSLTALHMAAAKLPSVRISRTERVIGTDTVSCMQSGIYWGYVGLVEGLVGRIKSEFGAAMQVIGTGGLAPLFAGATEAIDRVDPDLTLWGLRLIYGYNSSTMSLTAPRPSAFREHDPDALYFLPLGGSGEIGMNLNLYGYRGQWLIVDCGVTFGEEEHQPGVDVIMADPAFIVERRDRLLGIVATHGHEDHIGAIPYLWPQLQCPIWATPFTASLLRAKLVEAQLRQQGQDHDRADVGPVHDRAVRPRTDHADPFDPGAERGRDPHPGRHRAAHRRLEARPGPAGRLADRREQAARGRRRGRAGDRLRFDKRAARRDLRLRGRAAPASDRADRPL